MVEKLSPGVGADIGTMNIVSARKTLKGVETRRIRDAFLELPVEAKKMLKLTGVGYVERPNEILILGDAALETANIFGREARRPLASGMISSREGDALEILVSRRTDTPAAGAVVLASNDEVVRFASWSFHR